MAVNVSQAFTAAGNKWGIPTGVLFGVYGKETDFGRDIKTSSAGAVGPFQFIPSTAATYHYPLTNRPTDKQFLQQLDSTGHYLHDLYRQTGSWDTALRRYSGGGYGLADVKAKANSKELQAAGIFGAPITFGTDFLSGQTTAQGAASSGGDVSSSITTLLQPQTLVKIVEIVGGLMLAYIGVKQLTNVAGAK